MTSHRKMHKITNTAAPRQATLQS